MARKPRIEYEGAAYHVMSRGNAGADIFLDDCDRRVFLDTLGETCGRTGWEIHAFVLMGNHYHLLISTPGGNLVAGMKWLQGTYTQRFNSRHRRRGHLFQGRYRAQNIDEAAGGDYFRTVADYIHLNPARAGLLGEAGRRVPVIGYPWSSLPYYSRRANARPSWLKVETVLGEHALRDVPSGRRSYVVLLERRIESKTVPETPEGEREDSVRSGWLLGDDGFAQRMKDQLEEMLDSRKAGSLDGMAVREVDEQGAEALVERCMEVLSLKEEDFAGTRKRDARKVAICGVVKSRTSVGNDWIRQRLGMGHASNVSNAARAFREGSTAEVARMRALLVKAGLLDSKD